ncbi:FliC/FljB family flagellin [Microbulbifer thermotolerans]|uniref:Flagellin n=1 Tax=Microbulbifer thermotolerans TaxID=252514 RepID=A0A143HN70_MICTH|nr:FliC/FljB family flagellin [Microbulbifer thermotolerans]AMX03163.1 flagellin [Microbulbifer thermotolerans]MCX2783464.1 FliC/FljB family flagellin [Microbulbifer thermotolerans]MCX2795858.1 FliC/FljB family flagellin [Microbulbifer thermotolerans]MCX2835516.1 FliC/FljB family flagellin [Microbulbifer thermotolerans]WKT59728.1 FliC/FljB family flagellin [Microbulbifer thermotolerans]
MSVINTNITALIGQQNLSKSQSALQTSMERLSSGLRINSAKDDAAGQAIANRMSAQITGLSQAQRNANDGISVAQTAEGALNQVNENLQRIRELTVQSQNGTNSPDDLKSIQAEIDQRLTEINRISEQTDFNGVKVLADDQTLSIQVGANDGETISISLKEITASTLGLASFNVNGPQGAMTAQSGGTTAAMKDAFGTTTMIADSSISESNAGDLAARLGVTAGSVVFTGTAQTDEAGNWYAEVTITANSTAESNSLKALGFDLDNGASGTFYIALEPSDADVTTSPTTAAFSIDTASISLSDLTTGRTSNGLAALDSALETVDELRSDLGAIQNRFESAITNLQTNETNLSAARSRIEDADYAVEVSNMTRAQILQQAGTSVLAQANQVPQNVLSLLG